MARGGASARGSGSRLESTGSNDGAPIKNPNVNRPILGSAGGSREAQRICSGQQRRSQFHEACFPDLVYRGVPCVGRNLDTHARDSITTRLADYFDFGNLRHEGGPAIRREVSRSGPSRIIFFHPRVCGWKCVIDSRRPDLSDNTHCVVERLGGFLRCDFRSTV